MATLPETPTITPPRVPLIDPRTGQIDRTWFLFFLNLFRAVRTMVDSDVGPDTAALVASLEAAMQQENQGFQSAPSSSVEQVQPLLEDLATRLDTLPPSQVSSAAELSRTNDTNVTMTLSGSPSTALLNPVSMTLGWTGELPVTRGGTGLSAITANRIPFGDGTSPLRVSSALSFDGTNLGVGRSVPIVPLDVVGTTRWANNVAATDSWQRFSGGTGLVYDGTTTSTAIAWITNGGERMRITAAGNVVAGGSVALATTATNGFLYVPTCAGTPTGTPTAITGMAPLVVDSTNNKLYFYSSGAWRDAGP